MKTRNGFSSLISEVLDDFALRTVSVQVTAVNPAASKPKIDSGFVVATIDRNTCSLPRTECYAASH